MKCPHCKTENQANRKFCTACGKALRKTVTCGNCRKAISADSRFCGYCGNEVGKISGNVKKQSSKRNQSPKGIKKEVIALSAVALFIVLIVFLVARSVRSPQLNAPVIPQVSAISLQVDRIAANFTCPCGECSLLLKDCTCDNSKPASIVTPGRQV